MSGKAAIVVGTGEIGGATARAYAREGAEVLCLDVNEAAARSAAEAIVADGGRATSARCDSMQPDEIEAAMADGISRLGRLDAFMTTVGGGAEPTPFLDLALEDFRYVMERNVTAVFYSAQLAAKQMAKQGSGSIILTSSQLGQVAFPNMAHYCASKGAVNQLVKVMATDLAPHGVRVNAIGPGPTRGKERQQELLEGPKRESALHALGNILMERFGLPEETAAAALFLASDESSFVTGTTLIVDGGYVTR